MKNFIFLAVLAVCAMARADCTSSLPLKGMQAIDNCDPAHAKCVRADQALYAYMVARKDAGEHVLTIGLHGSPWHLYGPEYHIIDIDELAGMVRQQGSKIQRVVLLASWSGVAPDRHTKSLAQQLSSALGGMPVAGQDGFVMYAKDGTVRTTRQAFTGVKSGPYWVAEGAEVMASLVPGWSASLEPQFAKERDAAGLRQAGVANDIYLLCPERALAAFDASAALADPIAAYNAAVMRMARGAAGDADAAIKLLTAAAGAGDKKAQAKLAQWRTR